MAGPARFEAERRLRARTGKHAAGCVNKFCSMTDERTVTESPTPRADLATAFALFDTALGVCGIAWHDEGVVGVHLPARDAAATRMRLEQNFAMRVNPSQASRSRERLRASSRCYAESESTSAEYRST